METKPAIILFDGVCNLCNGFVQFVINHNPHGHFRFASLQSDTAREILHNLPPTQQNIDSVVLFQNNRFYQQSTAALLILRQLQRPWPLLYGAIILPALFRDFVYKFIARNRYTWFGQRESCMLPTPELKARFL